MSAIPDVAHQPAQRPSPRSLRRWQEIALLGSLSMFAPLSTDMYLPALPSVTHDLSASASAVQLTLTACLLGLGVGQLVIGPISDAFGRRRPVLLGLAVYTLASGICALAPDVWTLAAMRFVQGFAGAAGIVVVRAIVRDLYSGREAALLFARLMIVFGLAPVLAPIIGGQLLHVTDWRGIFWALAAIGVVLTAVGWGALGETLPPAARHRGGLVASLRVLGVLVRNRPFMAVTFCFGLYFGAVFAYIAGSPFILENIFGISPQLFGVLFAVCAAALVVASQLGQHIVARVGAERLIGGGLLLGIASAVTLLAAVLAHAGAAVVVSCFVVLMAGFGLMGPNLTAMAMAPFARSAGSASALMGLVQFGIGAAVAPLVGLGGTHDALPTATVIAACVLAAAAAARVFTTSAPAPEAPGTASPS